MTENKDYNIVCLGSNCLPRVITTVCGLKPTRAQGEKTCPFDLCFSLDFDEILNLLDSKFKNFYENVKLDKVENEGIKSELNSIYGTKLISQIWHNPKSKIVFIHENDASPKSFVDRYDNRIKNLYDYIKDKNKRLYFVISTFKSLSDDQIKRLNSIVRHYRTGDFYNIIINQSSENMEIHFDNTFVINYNKPNWLRLYKSGWVEMLKNHEKYKDADDFYNHITDNLEKIILHETVKRDNFLSKLRKILSL